MNDEPITAAQAASLWGVSKAQARKLLAPLEPVGVNMGTRGRPFLYDAAQAQKIRDGMPGQGRRLDLITTGRSKPMYAREWNRVDKYVLPDDYEARWSIAGGKGGTKKTTTAVHAGIVLSRSGKTIVYDTDPASQSLTAWQNAYRAANGDDLPFHVIQYTSSEGLGQHATRMKREMNAKHLVFDIGGGNIAHYRQALRRSNGLILPVAISSIETITLSSALSVAEEEASGNEEPLEMAVLWCGVERGDGSELEQARAAAETHQWPALQTYIPNQKRFRHALGTCPDHCGPYEGAFREFITDEVYTNETMEEA